MKKKITHTDRVLQYIRDFGSITSFECMSELGIIDLPKKICLLQEQGHKFVKENITKKNRYGEPTTYKRYSLDRDDEK